MGKQKKLSDEPKKKYSIKSPKQFNKQFQKLSDEEAEEVAKVLTGIKKGTLDPTKIGRKMDLEECETQLACPECRSSRINWYNDKNSDEVHYVCLGCEGSAWMTKKEYEKAVDDFPERVIRKNLPKEQSGEKEDKVESDYYEVKYKGFLPLLLWSFLLVAGMSVVLVIIDYLLKFFGLI